MGHLCLALFDDNRTGFYTGLAVIALGSGGIKPRVASFVGDKHRAKVVFDAFYWIINFGLFFRFLLIPIFGFVVAARLATRPVILPRRITPRPLTFVRRTLVGRN